MKTKKAARNLNKKITIELAPSAWALFAEAAIERGHKGPRAVENALSEFLHSSQEVLDYQNGGFSI